MNKFIFIFTMYMLSMCSVLAQSILNAYTTLEEPLAKQLFEQFEKETSIKVQWIRLSGGETVARMERERYNPKASIWVGGVGLDHITAKSKQLTMPYIPTATKNTPDQYKDKDGHWVGLYVSPLTIVVNKNLIESLKIPKPTGWEDLTKPVYKGQVRIPNPNVSGTGYNIITTIRYLYKEDEKKTFDYLKRLNLNIDQYDRSGISPSKAVAIGEIAIAVGYSHDQMRLKMEGANIEIIPPVEGTGYELASMSIIKGGKEIANAQKFFDWVLTSKNAQTIFTQHYIVLVANNAIQHRDAISIDKIKVVNQNMEWDGSTVNKNRLLTKWTTEVRNLR